MVEEMLDGLTSAPAEEADVVALAQDMRPADRAEIAALGFSDAAKALRLSIQSSVYARAVWLPEGIACIYGVAPVSFTAGVGAPWLLGTKLIRKYAKTFVAAAPEYITEMEKVFPRLENIVDVRNRLSVAWLRYAGFTIRDPIPCGPEGFLFHPFDKEA